jgi:hypothetical protein
VGFFDGLLGRKPPAQPDLDAIFGLPAAAITLEVSLDFRATGLAGVAFRIPEGRAFADVQAEIEALLAAANGPAISVTKDSFGYTWIVLNTDPPDVGTLVTNLHAINSSLQSSGFGPQLLCAMIPFSSPSGADLGMVYLFKQGAFYPFAPLAGRPGAAADAEQRRDNLLELQIRDLLTGELSLEPDLSRWFAIWGAPVFPARPASPGQ